MKKLTAVIGSLIMTASVFINVAASPDSTVTTGETDNTDPITYSYEDDSQTAGEAVTAPDTVTDAPAVTAQMPEIFDGGNLKKGEYTVGNDITPGRYTITGNSNVRVYTEDGILKTNIILTKDKDSDSGVNSYVLTLRDKENLELSDDTNFEVYTPSKVTLEPLPSASPTATPKSDTAANLSTIKNNPKTGDTAPVATVSIAMLIACMAVIYIRIYKKKSN